MNCNTSTTVLSYQKRKEKMMTDLPRQAYLHLISILLNDNNPSKRTIQLGNFHHFFDSLERKEEERIKVN